jgi:hypothetical protein
MSGPEAVKNWMALMLAILALYFATWLGSLVLLKKIILAEYQIAFHGLSAYPLSGDTLGKED